MKIANIVPNVSARSVSFHWSDGKVTTYAVGDHSPDVQTRLMLLGAATKYQNAYAGLGDSGVAACRAASDEIHAQLANGDWDARGGAGVWVEAIARFMKQDVDDVRAKWATLDEKTRAKLRRHPDVQIAKAEIERERRPEAADQTDEIRALLK